MIARQDTAGSTRSSMSISRTGNELGSRKLSRDLGDSSWSFGSAGGSNHHFSPPSLSMSFSEYHESPELHQDDRMATTRPARQSSKSRKRSWAVENSRPGRSWRQASLDLERPKRNEREVYSGTSSTTASSHLPSHSRKTSVSRLKPLLARNTSDETNSLDLNRTTLENEGLGIYTNLERDRRHEDPSTSKVTAYHARSTSGNSNLSIKTSSTTSKPGSQYVHPMRQNPRPYTPPLSHTNSSGSGSSAGEVLRIVESENEARDSPLQSISITPPLRIQTPGSFIRTASSSQIQLDHSSSSYRDLESFSPSDNMITPLSRASLDRGFRRKNSEMAQDPYIRAASVQAAREAFEQKEAAKAQKLLEKDAKARERQQQNLHRRKSSGVRPSLDTFRRKSTATRPSMDVSHSSPVVEKSAGVDLYYDETGTVDYSSSHGPRDVKSTWILFLTWLRTRLFKLKRRATKKHR